MTATDQAPMIDRVPQDEALFADLNSLFAELVEAANRYLHLRATTKGLDRLVVQDLLQTCQQRALAQAEQVATKIIQLGGVVALDLRLRFPAEKSSGADAIRIALAYEQGALDVYRDLLEKVGGNPVIEDFVRQQVSAQSEHVAKLYALLET